MPVLLIKSPILIHDHHTNRTRRVHRHVTARRSHALIIEDELLVAFMIEDLLTEIGFRSFDIAVTEAEAVEAAAARRPDMITSDVKLLVGCGINAVQTISPNLAIPIVFVTVHADKVRERSASAVIVDKPVETEVFRWGVGTARNQRQNASAFISH